MAGTEVTLSDGTKLLSQGVVFATGWVPGPSMFEPQTALELGLPAPLEAQDPATASYWDALESKADAEILASYPILKEAPKAAITEMIASRTPFRLYRRIIPYSLAAADDRSLIVLGMLANLQYSMYSEIAALWGISWMENLLPEHSNPRSKAEIDAEIARFNVWSAKRYPPRGRKFMVAGGEIQDIIDLLMGEMDLKIHRKWWLSDTFIVYRAQNYKGIVKDVLARSKGTKSIE